MSLAMAGVVIVGSLHIAWACGFLSVIGLSGFASAEDLTRTAVQLTSIQQSLKQNDIDRDMRQVCMARAAGNQSALTAWSITLQRDEQSFAQLAKAAPQVMDCETLMVTQSNG